MLNQVEAMANKNEPPCIEIVISISEARTLIERWSKATQHYVLELEYSQDGIEMLLAQSKKRFRITTGNSNKRKYFTDTRSVYKWIASLFPSNRPDCEIVSLYH